MHIESLRLFNKIAVEKSISKVAIDSHISQPALSQQMQRLEESVDAKLFERSNKGIELTPAGKIMESYSLQLFQIYENLIDDLNTLKHCSTTFRIYSVPEVGMYSLPCTMKKIKRNLPSCNFNLTMKTQAEVENQVKLGNADIGFIIDDSMDKSLVNKPFRTDKIVLAASKNFEIKDIITTKDFAALPLLKLQNSYSTSLLLEKHAKLCGITISDFYMVHTLNSIDSLKTLLSEGNGVAFLPYFAIKKELSSNLLKTVEIEGFNLEYRINMIHNNEMTDNSRRIIYHFLQQTKCLTCVA